MLDNPEDFEELDEFDDISKDINTSMFDKTISKEKIFDEDEWGELYE